jgi:hypothetical protein
MLPSRSYQRSRDQNLTQALVSKEKLRLVDNAGAQSGTCLALTSKLKVYLFDSQHQVS